ncbi:protein SLOW GREEN 1, chloroplastic-like [Olea europaea var. sylvestris]|uniref:SLOW GREEN 1, chloroplastic-like n=1 Tax=Olea europaea subsp. europaea TaxID=158383 RepID=A0A8S0QJC9_OLEEU|nr:protein SLOW GREEN 1, chloroplastic-like [Olea europaea var. sylvestris]CAA2967552.1 SLOW GREEN 1, chloroplastic-like [Olea europaea subsp. europaea]
MVFLNSTVGKTTSGYLPPIPSLHPHRPFFSRPLSFRNPPTVLPLLSRKSVASSSPSAAFRNPEPKNSNKPSHSEEFLIYSVNPISRNSFTVLSSLRTALITTVTAAVLFFSGFCFSLQPGIALADSPAPTVETAANDALTEEEREKSLEVELSSNPYDVRALKNLMEIKIKSKKIPEAIGILDKLIELEPEEHEWPLLKAHLHAYNEEIELARRGFNELLKVDPFRVEAYHGLVTAASQEESGEELEKIKKKVEEAMKLCKTENKKSDLRDFKLLFAQIRVIEGDYDDALTVYKELVKEEPRDFRPYLCQGIIYTLLRKNGEAEKNFEKYRSLVPKEHPYAKYIDDNMLATKIFAQKVEKERAAAKS